MPETNQFTWSHKELVTLLIKQADIHEGRWWLLVNFGMGAANFGPSEDQVAPGAFAAVTNIGIQREVPPNKAPSGLVVDAAEVNPVQSTRAKKPKA